uniref:proteasome endopeptidase complex n=1 Tax=Oncorhynchus mykiss TaxID=8022 RepID=A0A8C7VDC9_ONCMY
LPDGLPPGGLSETISTYRTIIKTCLENGVVLGADTRATSGEVVADKMCAKIHYISPNIYCCGAGTAADTEKTTDLLSSNLTIFSMNSGRNPRVVMAVNILQDMLFRYRGQIGASLILVGWDNKGPGLYYVDDNATRLSGRMFSTGCGSSYAYGVIDSGSREDMTVEEAYELGRRGITHATHRDAYSGGVVKLMTI